MQWPHFSLCCAAAAVAVAVFVYGPAKGSLMFVITICLAALGRARFHLVAMRDRVAATYWGRLSYGRYSPVDDVIMLENFDLETVDLEMI